MKAKKSTSGARRAPADQDGKSRAAHDGLVVAGAIRNFRFAFFQTFELPQSAKY